MSSPALATARCHAEPETVSHKLTAIVPVYNGRELLKDALASIRAQTRPVDEVIVVDDASTDDSAAVARALGASVIRFEQNQGPSAARNAGLRAATSDLVAFLDADDMWLPNHCELLVSALELHPGAALASSRTQILSVMDRHSAGPPAGRPFDALPFLIRYNFVIQSSVIARRDALMASGGYDESMRYSEDYRLWLAVAVQHDFVYVPAVTVTRRLHAAQATWNNELPLYEATWRLRLDMLTNGHLAADPVRLKRVVVATREAASIDYGMTWRALDAASFDLVHRAVKHLPGAQSLRRRWHRRRLLLWHGWRLTVLMVRHLRAFLRPSS